MWWWLGGGGDGFSESPDNQQVWFHKRTEWSWLSTQLFPPPLNAREHRHMQPHMGAHVGELLLGSVSGQCAELQKTPSLRMPLVFPWCKNEFNRYKRR